MGAFRFCLGVVWEVSGGIKEYQGVFRVYFVSETAQDELRSGRVYAPARAHEPRVDLLNVLIQDS